jgi:hypothetical protein
MQFLLMIYLTPQWHELSSAEKNRIHEACGAWHEELVRSGHTRGAFGLQPPATATTLRQRHGKVVLTDGPHAETKEMLGGFEVVECAHRDEALAIAQRFPGLHAGATVEVRPTAVGGECRD